MTAKVVVKDAGTFFKNKSCLKNVNHLLFFTFFNEKL